MPIERAAATAVRLLDLGYFRIGSDAYADEHGSYGLTTLERRHVRVRDGRLVFTFVGKSGISTSSRSTTPRYSPRSTVMRRRRGGDRLLAYRDRSVERSGCHPGQRLPAEMLGGQLTAKDFRTWHATVIAAAAVAESDEPGDTAASRKRAIRAAVAEVAQYLGNTPTIARNSYIDPRVFELYEDGVTIEAAVRRTTRRRRLDRPVWSVRSSGCCPSVLPDWQPWRVSRPTSRSEP